MYLSESDSGLVVAEHGSDGAAVARALREYDPDLRLVPQASQTLGTILWKVYKYMGGDRPAVPVLSWRTRTGEPLPLSMRLLDKVKELDPNTRSELPDADRLNELVRRERAKDFERDMEAARDDWLPREGRIAAFHRSPGLAVARRRGRRKGVSS